MMVGARRLIIIALIALPALAILSPAASAGMVWGQNSWIQGVAVDDQDHIYLTTPDGLYQITTTVTVPEAIRETDGQKGALNRPVTASKDGTRIATVAGCEEGVGPTESEVDMCDSGCVVCPYNKILVTDGDLERLLELDYDVPQLKPTQGRDYGTLHLSDDGSRLYAQTLEGLYGISTSDGSELWSIPCGGPSRLLVSVTYSSATDRVAYSCAIGASGVPGVGTFATSVAAVLDGSDGTPLWQAQSPGFTWLDISPGGKWLQLDHIGDSGADLYKFPSLVPEMTWDQGDLYFLSDEDQFVLVETEPADPDDPLNPPFHYTFDWYDAPDLGGTPQMVSSKEFRNGSATWIPLAQDNQFLVAHTDRETKGTLPEWEYYHTRRGQNDTTFNSTFHRFGRDGVLLESGPSTPYSEYILAVPNSLHALVYTTGGSNHVTFFAPDAVNKRPVFGQSTCEWDEDLATVDVLDPDNDNVRIYWNFSRALWTNPITLIPDLVDAIGPSATLSEDASPASVIAMDEHGALSASICGRAAPEPHVESAGSTQWLILAALLLVGVVARQLRRPHS